MAGLVNKIKKVVYITSTSFPFGSASAARTRNMVGLLKYCGFSVTVVADYNIGDDEFFDVVYLSDCQGNQKKMSLKCIETLKELQNKQSIDLIITNAVYHKVKYLIPFCKHTGVKLVVENCEWYDKSNYKYGAINPHYLRNQIMLKLLFKKVDAFISISRFLDERNSSLNKPSVRIPTIINKEALDYDLHGLSNKIILSYCGNPGPSKELLCPIIKAIKSDNKYTNKIEFHIYGPSREQIFKNKGIVEDDINNQFVFIHGKKSQQDMHTIFKKTDFLIFIRPNRRSSNAGFPTKLAESMIAGTPVIANDTGDISLYLNEATGFLLKDISVQSIRECLNKILNLSNIDYIEMRKKCRKIAEGSFDYRKYKNDIFFLIKKLENK